VTVTIPRRNLVYFQDDGAFVSRYRIRAIQRVDGRAMRMQEWSERARVETFEQTRANEAERRTLAVDLLDVASDTERFRLDIEVEIEGTRRTAMRTVRVQPRRYEQGGIALAELALYQRTLGGRENDGGLVVLGRDLPDSRIFRRQENRSFDLATAEPWLLVRVFDLRSVPQPEPYRVEIRSIGSNSNEPRWSDVVAVDRAGDETAVLVRLPAAAFVFGENRVRVTLAEAEAAEITLQNLGLDLGDERSWNANLQQIEVLASSAELRELRDAEPGQRRERWDDFWSRRDPEPDTPENERLQEHFRRVAHARSFLQDGFSDGALSDRGRIWVLHGRPDVIDTSAQGFRSYSSYEVWTYRELGVVYYFQDTDGFGAFRLVWREVD
jgi:GWxTD domain-containing protein